MYRKELLAGESLEVILHRASAVDSKGPNLLVIRTTTAMMTMTTEEILVGVVQRRSGSQAIGIILAAHLKVKPSAESRILPR
jgi:hypothetical protein